MKALIVIIRVLPDGSLSYRNQSIDLLCKSMDWFLYVRDLRHESVNAIFDKLKTQYLANTNSDYYFR